MCRESRAKRAVRSNARRRADRRDDGPGARWTHRRLKTAAAVRPAAGSVATASAPTSHARAAAVDVGPRELHRLGCVAGRSRARRVARCASRPRRATCVSRARQPHRPLRSARSTARATAIRPRAPRRCVSRRSSACSNVVAVRRRSWPAGSRRLSSRVLRACGRTRFDARVGFAARELEREPVAERKHLRRARTRLPSSLRAMAIAALEHAPRR